MASYPWPIITPPHPDAVDHFVAGPTKPPRMYQAYTDTGDRFLIGEAGLEAYGPDILKPPHLVTLPPRPEPEPLSEDDLAALEAKIEGVSPYGEADELHTAYLADVPALIAEVRRLRAELAGVENCYHWRRGDCTPNDSE